MVREAQEQTRRAKEMQEREMAKRHDISNKMADFFKSKLVKDTDENTSLQVPNQQTQNPLN